MQRASQLHSQHNLNFHQNNSENASKCGTLKHVRGCVITDEFYERAFPCCARAALSNKWRAKRALRKRFFVIIKHCHKLFAGCTDIILLGK
uniref:Uncharacterized protein n=1 Tax=Rhipicephalus zambeziensis TaxID=60191 RepID=A0A224YJQ7_9ACAR